MKISDLNTYEDLELFLRNWSNASGDPVPYDFNGLMYLMLAIVDNMKEHSIDTYLEDYSCSINDDQALFLKKLLNYRKKFSELD
jgi:hypothetical protein